MSIHKGSSLIRESGSYGVYHGSTPIKSIYKGSTLIYNFSSYTPGQVLFESATPGTYSLNIESQTTLYVVLVGAGGGGSSCHYALWERGRNGGQGSMISGNISINAGSYSITIGAAGVGQRLVDNGGSAYGTDGGSTTFLGNTAAGGKGSGAHTGWYDGGSDWGGDGGAATVVTSGLTGSNGANYSTASKYGSYGGGGIGNASTAGNGQNGYVLIKVA